MGTFTDFLATLRPPLLSEEEAEVMEREREQWRLDQRQAAIDRQIARLSPRHVGYARELEAGAHESSPTWKQLSRALQEDPGASLLICGPTGVGKTTAAVREALRRAGEGWTVLHLSAARFDAIARADEAREEAESVDLLILDQLHRLPDFPSWIATPIRELVDSRYERHRQTIGLFTGTAPEAAAALKSDVVERLGAVLQVGGVSYRRTW
ncbi:MAG: hypothetical protein RBU35_20665 [Anaerolineae bacterium]|jgi:DNA replication protein DnaC|nr:hypothetical protein [Anaerolineae bacterium]